MKAAHTEVRSMSGAGRQAAHAIEMGITRKRGHRTRWQARVERLDGRVQANAVEDTHSRRLNRMRSQQDPREAIELAEWRDNI